MVSGMHIYRKMLRLLVSADQETSYAFRLISLFEESPKCRKVYICKSISKTPLLLWIIHVTHLRNAKIVSVYLVPNSAKMQSRTWSSEVLNCNRDITAIPYLPGEWLGFSRGYFKGWCIGYSIRPDMSAVHIRFKDTGSLVTKSILLLAAVAHSW